MSEINATKFITEHFLLNSKEAVILYHEFAKDLPIIDYHNHLSAKQIAEDKPVENITNAWLSGDHYKWRGMRANGIEEYYITGESTLEEKFEKWAETVPYTLRNPLFHWTQLELKRYFDIDTILQPSSAKEIYKKANEILANKTPAQLLEDMKVEVVCTTDDPTDDLRYHQKIAIKKIYTKVLPTFRSDELFYIGHEKFYNYLKKLSACSNIPIENYSDFLRAIDIRIDFFQKNGCQLSDYGVPGSLIMEPFNEDEVVIIFDKNLKREQLSPTEIAKYKSSLMLHLAKRYQEKGWVQQYHLGAIRNNNKRLQETLGSDAGCDSIGDYSMAEGLSTFFNTLDYSNKLAKTITYNLDPSQNELFATMMGNFQRGTAPGKMQWGSGWWFLDQKDGMEKQLNALSNMGLLSRFVGMLTDSRSFLSFPRHEYFRRILCSILAEDFNNGLVPKDLQFLGKMVQDICYYNAVNYFQFNNVKK